MTTTVHLSYEEAWSFLDRLQFHKIKLGLDSMKAFMESLDNPHLQFPCIHIGGTNGKGSVGATMLAILTAAGYRVGFYTSPHLSSVRERFRIGNDFITREDFARLAERIVAILNGRQITYFEFTTALAMLWFAEQKVDLVILEVGLGGRLDATNIVTPLVSVITNVTMDHEQYLGNTIQQIAFEKAGIIKPGVPVVTGTDNKQALEVIIARAGELASPLTTLDREFAGFHPAKDKATWTYKAIDSSTMSDLPLSMRGEYQVTNAAVALAALEVIKPFFPVSREQLDTGLARVSWPGRLEEFWRDQTGRVSREPSADLYPFHFLLDGAHNPDGARALRLSLADDFEYERLIMVWASMADKDISTTLMQIAPLADTIIFTRPDEERSARPEQLKILLPEGLQDKAVCIESVRQALDHALAAYSPGSMICVAGSLYLVGLARQILCGGLVGDE